MEQLSEIQAGKLSNGYTPARSSEFRLSSGAMKGPPDLSVLQSKHFPHLTILSAIPGDWAIRMVAFVVMYDP